MTPVVDVAVRSFAAEIAAAAGLCVDSNVVTERAALMGLEPGGEWSWNRSCRLLRAADGWLAVNLPREADLDAVPAWLGSAFEGEVWPAILRAARDRPADDLAADGQRLGLAVARVGSVSADTPAARLSPMGEPGVPGRRPVVLDLSSLWAGPLCGRLLAQAGAEVIKVESVRRPDAVRQSSPAFFERLNGAKQDLALDFGDPVDLARLRTLAARADVVITSARPRAFEQLGLAPSTLFAARPSLIWVAVTAYGWFGEAGMQVGFGDDAAAAGGLVDWTEAGEPRFAGDALADPLTGLAAAAAAFKALACGGGQLVDAGLAPTAAGVMALARREAAA